MTRLNVATLFLFATGLLATLNMMGIFPFLTYLLPIFVLGVFLNCIDILHQVLVLGDLVRNTHEFLEDMIPYQMEDY